VRRVLSFARVFFEEEEEKFFSLLSEKTTREKVEQKNEESFVWFCAHARTIRRLSLPLSLSISRKRAHARAREKGCGLCALILKRYTITKNTDTYIYLLPFFSLYEFYFWGLLVFEPIEIFVPLLPISHQRVDFFL